MSESPILRRYLQTVVPSLDDRMDEFDVFFFGAGGSGKSFLAMYPELSPKGFIDNSPSLWGEKIGGIEVYSPAHLANQDPSRTAIFITSDYRTEILTQLSSFGFNATPHQLAGRPAFVKFDDLQALFFASFEELYSALCSTTRKFQSVVVLRDYESYPEPSNGDVDVIADYLSFDSLRDAAESNQPFPGAFRLDLSLAGEFQRQSYPPQIKDLVLRHPVHNAGVLIPSRLAFAAAFAYHAVLHKSPLFTGIDECLSLHNADSKYTRGLSSVLDVLGLDDGTLTQESLIAVLMLEGWAPETTELRRIASIQEECRQGNLALRRWANRTS